MTETSIDRFDRYVSGGPIGTCRQDAKKQLGLLMVLMLCGAVAELMTIGAVLPFLALMAEPARAASYPQLQSLFAWFGWNEPNQLLLPATLLFAIIVILAAGMRIFLIWASQKFVLRLGYDLSIDVYRRTLYQPYSYHVSKNSSELIAGIGKVSAGNWLGFDAIDANGNVAGYFCFYSRSTCIDQCSSSFNSSCWIYFYLCRDQLCHAPYSEG